MSARSYPQAIKLVLAHEGGFVNHPKDPGGATNFGVTQAVYDAYRKFNKLDIRTVKLVSPLEVQEIYRKQYWNAIKGDDLPAGLDYAVFDFAVNSGVSRAIRYLQRMVLVNDDAVLGFTTLTAVENFATKNELEAITEYCSDRVAFLKSLSTFPTFGKGWMRRVEGYRSGVQTDDSGVVDFAVKMALADDQYTLPKAIGANVGEEAGKAISPDYDSWPMAKQNDYLAQMIGE